MPSLHGLPIEQASIQVVDQWKLGGRKTDKGVLLMVAAQDRKLRIEVGQGLDDDLVVAAGEGFTILLDHGSAGRAQGLLIDFVDDG